MALINKDAEEKVNATAETETATEPKAQPEEKAVAVKPAAGAVTKSGSFWCDNEAVLEVVSSAEYGDFPQIVASQGSFSTAGQDSEDLGSWIAFTPILAKEKKVCSPNSNDDEAKEYFAAAYVGELLMDGRTIEDALADAKAASYERATIKDYTDLFVKVISHEKGDGFMDGEVVCFQLAPMSRIAWNKFSKQLRTKAAFGELEGDITAIKAVAKKAKNKGSKEYTFYTFELA